MLLPRKLLCGDSKGLVRAEHVKFLHIQCLLKPCHVPCAYIACFPHVELW